jgi:arylsulfatase A-like enzyme
MTGLYPSRLGLTRNGNDTFPADAPPVISRLIADAGYHCGLIGKFHLVSGGHRPEPRQDDGFVVWQHSHAPRDDWPEGTHDYADWVRAQGQDLDAMRNSPEGIDPAYHQTKWASDRAIEFIDREHDVPWMLNINVYDPHPPFVPPRVYADQFDPADMPGPHVEPGDAATQERLASVEFQPIENEQTPEEGKRIQALYYAMIAQIDDQFARILEVLETTGQRDNTVIIFTSDHGETLGDHGQLRKGCRFYEGLVRVPLIFSWPGQFESNRQCEGLTELLDLSATLLEIAGVPIPDYHQGYSLLPTLIGEHDGSQLRDAARCEYFDALDPHFTGGDGSYGTMYRDATHKLSLYHDKQLGELYDLDEDPWEHEDMWSDEEAQALKNELILKSFNQHVCVATDVGSERIAPM